MFVCFFTVATILIASISREAALEIVQGETLFALQACFQNTKFAVGLAILVVDQITKLIVTLHI